MSTQNMFENASRMRLRFESKVGLLTLEDLWQLPLQSKTKASLDEIAIGLKKALGECNESFVEAVSIGVGELETKFELVKYIISVRLSENAEKLTQQQNAEKRELLKQLIAQKKNDALGNKSVEELEALLASVG